MNILKDKRILVVDDAEAERMLISTYLQQQGCRLYLAHDGLDGIHKARLVLPDLILMDVNMPHCGGFAACKVLAEEAATAHVPVIFLSAYSDPAQRVQGLVAGAVDFIAKPFDFDEVRLRLAVHLRHRDKPPAEIAQAAEEDADTAAAPNYLHEILFHSARVHLLKSLGETPDLQTLAVQVGTNSKRLNEAFKQCTGVTVFEYLREERMKEARLLLLKSGLPVREVALRVGFSSCANFSTAFKARFGCAPSVFRQGNVTESTS